MAECSIPFQLAGDSKLQEASGHLSEYLETPWKRDDANDFLPIVTQMTMSNSKAWLKQLPINSIIPK